MVIKICFNERATRVTRKQVRHDVDKIKVTPDDITIEYIDGAVERLSMRYIESVII